MKFIVVDVQGFNIPQFYAKELAIYDGRQMKSYLFKPDIPFHMLDEDYKQQIKYLYGNHHGIYYDYGETSYDDIYQILQENLRDADRIYVKGKVKETFLKQIFSEMKLKIPYILNLEFIGCNVPKLAKGMTTCPYHSLDLCMCSIKNSLVLYDYLEKLLPQ